MTDTQIPERQLPVDGEIAWLLVGLQNLYEGKRHCDVEIQVQNRTFSCHKVVLSAASEYFDAMFASGFQESKTNTAVLKEIDAEVFQNVVTFIYYGKSIINADNVESLLHASCLLQMKSLQEQCEQFLVSQLCSGNCVGFWLTAKTYSCKILQDASWSFLLHKFETIWTNEEFVRIEKDDLIAIIKDNKLNVSREETVCKAVLRWLDEGEDSRHSSIDDIFKHLRLTQVTIDFLLEEVDGHPIISKRAVCTQKVKNAIKYQTLPSRRHTLDDVDIAYRDNAIKSTYLVVLGQMKSSLGSNAVDLLAFNPQTRKWYSPTCMPFSVGDDFATCPYDNDIFLSGGTGKPNTMMRFSAKMCKWTVRSPMQNGRTRHAMVAVRDSLYCLGGFRHCALETVDEFDIATDTWQSVGSLSKPVYASSAAVLKEKVYVFGGCRGFAEGMSAVQCFDTVTKHCTIIAKLPFPCRDTRALTSKNKIYVVCPSGEVIEFGQKHDLRILSRANDFRKRNFGLHREGNKLFILGGEELSSQDHFLDERIGSDEIVSVALPDHTAAMLELPSLLPAQLEVYGCYRTVIQSKYPFTEISEQFG